MEVMPDNKLTFAVLVVCNACAAGQEFHRRHTGGGEEERGGGGGKSTRQSQSTSTCGEGRVIEVPTAH